MYQAGQVLSHVFTPSNLPAGTVMPSHLGTGFCLSEGSVRAHRVYNFEVENHHTYIAGGIRVHNKSVLDFLSGAEWDNVDFNSLKDLNKDGSPDYVELNNGLGGYDAEGGTVYKLETIDGQQYARVYLTHADQNGNLYQTQYLKDANGDPIPSSFRNVALTGQQFGYELGGLVTPFITAALLDDGASVFERFATDTVIGTLVRNLFEFGGAAIHDQIASNGFQNNTLTVITNVTFADLMDETIANGVDNAQALLTQWIMAEVFEGLSTDSFGGKFATLLAQHGVNYLLDASINTIAVDVLKINPTDIQKLELTVGQFSEVFSTDVIMSLVFKAAVGTILPDLESQEAQIGSSVLSLVAKMFWGFNPIGAAVLGYIGGLILDLLFDEDPEAYTRVVFSDAMDRLILSNTSENDGGDEGLSRSMANAFADFINGVIEQAGSNANNLKTIAADNSYRFGHDEDKLVNGDGRKYNDVEDAVVKRMLDGLADLRLYDGDLKVAKAIQAIVNKYNSTSTTNPYTAHTSAAAAQRDELINELSTRIQVAKDYQAYLENQHAYDQLIATSPDSGFTAGWVTTLLLAERYGMTTGFVRNGTGLAEFYRASSGNDSLRGAAGQDTIYGYSGADTLFGDADHDRIFGGADNDWLDGGDGNDTIYAGLVRTM